MADPNDRNLAEGAGPIPLWSPYEGAPGGVFGQMAAQAIFDPIMQKMGMAPAGLNDQNLYDRMKAKRLSDMNQEVLRQLAKQERDTYMATIKGLAAMAGVQWNPEREQAAMRVTDFAANNMHLAASMFPDLVDQFTGGKSRAVMGYHLMQGGQYRTDPVTGAHSTSPHSTARMTNRIYDRLFEFEGGQNISGLRAGQVGELGDELIRRGLMGGPGDGDDLSRLALRTMGNKYPDRLRSAMASAGIDQNADIGKLTSAQLDKISAEPEVANAIRDVDASKITRRIQEFAGSIRAMSDLMAANGVVGMSVRDLLSQVDQFSQGALGQISPAMIEQKIRTLSNLADRSGLGMRAMEPYFQHAASMGTEYGLNRMFASDAVAQGIGFRRAFTDRAGAGDVFGLAGPDELALRDIGLRQSAAASPMANQVGALFRLGEAAPGGDMPWAPDSQIGKYVTAIRNNKSTANGKSVMMEDEQFVDMLTSGIPGLSRSQAYQALMDKGANQSSIYKNGIENNIRALQGATEVVPALAGAIGNALDATIDAPGNIIYQASNAAAAALMNMTDQEFGNKRGDSRNQIVGEAMRKVLQPSLGEQTPAYWAQMAESAYGAANTESRYRMNDSLANIRNLHSPDVLGRAESNVIDATVTGMIQSVLGGDDVGTALTRAMKAIQEADPSDPDAFKRVLARAFGGTGGIKQEKQDEINNILKKLSTEESTYDAEEAALDEKERADPTRVGEFREQRQTLSLKRRDALKRNRRELQGATAGLGLDDKLRDQASELGAALEKISMNGKLIIEEAGVDARTARLEATGTPGGSPAATGTPAAGLA